MFFRIPKTAATFGVRCPQTVTADQAKSGFALPGEPGALLVSRVILADEFDRAKIESDNAFGFPGAEDNAAWLAEFAAAGFLRGSRLA